MTKSLPAAVTAAVQKAQAAAQGKDFAAAASAYADAAALGAPDRLIACDHAWALSQAGHHAKAVTILKGWFDRNPKNGFVVNLMGVLLKRAGRLHDAATVLDRARRLQPDQIMAWQNLGNVYQLLGQPEKAIFFFQGALKIQPSSTDLWRRLGQEQSTLGQHDAACTSFARALDLDPANRVLAAHFVQSLQRAGRPDEARAKLAQLRAGAPDDPEIAVMMARFAFNAGDTLQSENLLFTVLTRQPGQLQASLLLATYLGDKDRQTVNAVLDRAVQANPDNFDVLDRLVESLSRSRYGSEAAHIEKAYGLAQQLMDRFAQRIPDAARSLRTIMMQVLDEDGMARTGAVSDLLPVWQARGAHACVHYELGQVRTLDDRLRLVDWHRTWGQRVAARITPVTPVAMPALATGRKLRIGFMSSDLRQHPITYFALPLLESYDRDRVEVYCYSFYERAADRIQTHIQNNVTAFHHWPKRPDAQVAEGIAADGLDILFELGGSTAMNKLQVMAYRPARLGASWLGYPHSAGLEQIDLILTDPYIRPDDARLLIERPFEMPDTWVALSRMFAAHEIAPDIPQDRKGHLTFGTANNPYKYTPACLDAWAAVLRAVPGSRFVFLRPEGAVASFQTGARKAFARRDVDPDRIDFIGVRGDHMRHYNQIDIALDTLPHVGGTTTCEALWMGVPTITLVGPGFPERLSYSNLSNAGLGDLATFSPQDYVARAVELAADPARRRALRQGLRAQIAANPLGQPDKFAKDFYDLARKVASA